MRFLWAIIFSFTTITACAAPVMQTPLPTPQVVITTFTPATRNWQPVFDTCADSIPQLRLLVQELPFSQVELASGLSIRLGTPTIGTPYSAAQVGEEQIVIIVNPDNPTAELAADDLRSIYTGQYTTWDELNISYAQNLHVWSYPETDELSLILLSALWRSNPPMIMAYLAPNPEAMLEAVRADPGAIGYLPSSWLINTDLEPVSLETKILDALRQPVLVLSALEPQGLEHSLISCLQATPK